MYPDIPHNTSRSNVKNERNMYIATRPSEPRPRPTQAAVVKRTVKRPKDNAYELAGGGNVIYNLSQRNVSMESIVEQRTCKNCFEAHQKKIGCTILIIIVVGITVGVGVKFGLLDTSNANEDPTNLCEDKEWCRDPNNYPNCTLPYVLNDCPMLCETCGPDVECKVRPWKRMNPCSDTSCLYTRKIPIDVRVEGGKCNGPDVKSDTCRRDERACKAAQDNCVAQGAILSGDSKYCRFYGGSGAGAVTWEDARAKCSSMNATLPIIHDDSINEEVVKFGVHDLRPIRGWPWLGLTRNSTSSNYKFKWLDGTNTEKYEKFNEENVENIRDGNDCAILFSSGIWVLERCGDKNYVLCAL